ncbi:hypothetical protein DENSPDRAFT_573752 [Dentipellis sp. KUC8613]|nr:hypothetical protein DENSPDRAFT_573752 [Dentipellis sp. KUC8613]
MLPYWENYERELEVLDFGLPIWQAEPFDERDEVQVGDVGYVDEGRFRRVFNIFYGDTRITETTGSNGHQSQGPSTEPQPQPSSRATFRPAQYEAPLPNEYGVPDGHVPLQMPATEFRLHGRISKGWHYRGDYKSTEVSSQGGIDMTTPIPLESSVSFSFKSESQRFAALMLRTHGDHYKAPEGIFKAYSRRRWKQWRAFTSNQDAHYMHATKLMLVYGYTKTTAWTTVAIEGQRSSGRLEFNVDLPALGSTGLDVQHRREATTSPHTNHGPWRPQMETEDEESVATLSTANPGLKQNQTVFIRRIMASEMSALERLRLAVRYRFGGRSGSGGVRRPLYERARDMVRRLGHPTIQGGDVASSRDHEKHSPADSEIGSTDADRHSHSSSATASRSSDDSYNISPGHHYVDPLEELLLYVLETERKAVSAVVSDDDVSKLTKIYKSSHDNRLPADMTELVKELRPETTTDEDGIAYLCGLDQSQVRGHPR